MLFLLNVYLYFTYFVLDCIYQPYVCDVIYLISAQNYMGCYWNDVSRSYWTSEPMPSFPGNVKEVIHQCTQAFCVAQGYLYAGLDGDFNCLCSKMATAYIELPPVMCQCPTVNCWNNTYIVYKPGI
jgi:hypothetical protein